MKGKRLLLDWMKNDNIIEEKKEEFLTIKSTRHKNFKALRNTFKEIVQHYLFAPKHT
jgi:hypothetical protein